MSSFYLKLRTAFAAAAFAEAGEFDTARQLMEDDTSAPPTLKSTRPRRGAKAGVIRKTAPAT